MACHCFFLKIVKEIVTVSPFQATICKYFWNQSLCVYANFTFSCMHWGISLYVWGVPWNNFHKNLNRSRKIASSPFKMILN